MVSLALTHAKLSSFFETPFLLALFTIGKLKKNFTCEIFLLTNLDDKQYVNFDAVKKKTFSFLCYESWMTFDVFPIQQ